MALQYQPQTYYPYGHPQWPEDVKPALTEDDSASILDDRVFDSSTPADMTSLSGTRRSSVAKIEDDYSTAGHVWQERSHHGMHPARQYSQSSISSSTHNQYYGHIDTSNCAPTFAHTQAWPISARSEANTPTPLFGPVQQSFDHQVQYHGGPVLFNFAQQDPLSAVSMSPQSSQGGCASTTSSDAPETSSTLRHRYKVAATAQLVARSDGIRKKNAKYEIPKDRNVNTIESLIQNAGTQEEKKELKQQKRLLRNRQAALDSRNRKKENADKLQLEKNALSQEKTALESALAQLQETLHQERQQRMHEHQQYQEYLQQLTYERDEAIRTKTLETADLRRRNNILQEAVGDLERQFNARTFAHDSDTFSNDFNSFKALDIEDTWDDGFSMINNDDMKMEQDEALQRQATPRPPTSTVPSSVPATKSEVKVNAAFSWETFYMCLLSGAFIMSQAGSRAANAAASVAVVAPAMPTMSDEYRAEAGNVLQAVLASGPENTHEILPSRPAASTSTDHNNLPDSLSQLPPQSDSTLTTLHNTLTTPSRHQRAQAAFSLSAEAYAHISSPDISLDDDNEPLPSPKPTRLQQLFATMQAERDGLEKISGLGSKARERSVLLDRVPEKVLRDFREMIARVE